MIGSMHLSALCEPLAGTLLHGDCEFSVVSTDTRSLQKDDLFVALTGPHFDGNGFVSQAAGSGAAGAIVSRRQEQEIPQLEVADTRVALGQLAHLNRTRFQGPVITVTGSSGKTTVKEMIARILTEQGVVLATEGNLNNDIGVPLTLLKIDDAHTHAVLELGASAVGEIAYTVALALPDVALITNAAGAHLEGFGSQENIVRAKGEIYGGLGEHGTGVVNLDDPAASYWQGLLVGKRVITFSRTREDADFCIQNVQVLANGMHAFRMMTPEGACTVQLGVPGLHNISNALAAAAAAHAVGASLETICAGLEAFGGVRGRLCRLATAGGAALIDDSYNANPASFRAAIDVLAAQDGAKILVMGDMAELGAEARSAHADIGAYARQQGLNHLFATGPLSAAACEAFGTTGQWYPEKPALTHALREHDQPGACFLVKGSRSAGMDAVVEALTKGEGC